MVKKYRHFRGRNENGLSSIASWRLAVSINPRFETHAPPTSATETLDVSTSYARSKCSLSLRAGILGSRDSWKLNYRNQLATARFCAGGSVDLGALRYVGQHWSDRPPELGISAKRQSRSRIATCRLICWQNGIGTKPARTNSSLMC